MTRRQPSTLEQVDAAVATSPWPDPCRWLSAHEIDPTLDRDRWRETIPAHTLIAALITDLSRSAGNTLRLHAELRDARTEIARLRAAARALNEAVDLAALFDLEKETSA